jgi:hypothetical protein
MLVGPPGFELEAFTRPIRHFACEVSQGKLNAEPRAEIPSVVEGPRLVGPPGFEPGTNRL